MRDPHVVSLRYRVETDKTVRFDNPPPVERETKAFRMRLSDGTVTFEMKKHYASKETARECVEPYLRTWEVAAALSQGRKEIGFAFEKAEVVDRDPPPPGTHQVIRPEAIESVIVGGTVTLSITRGQYPEPPSGFRLSPDVEIMLMRYEMHRAGDESLTSMASMCLSILEASAGRRNKRERAAKRYSVDEKVLGTLGTLTSEVGDERTARKVPKSRTYRPHSPAQTAWIEAVVRRLILRVGEWDFDPSATLPKLTMDHFPKLT